MLEIYDGSGKCVLNGALALMLLLPLGAARAQNSETVLYSFQGGNDGSSPSAGLIMDKSGNLYGTTYWGGGSGCDDGLGCGTVFEFPSSGSETVLHAFAGQPSDGAWPWGGVIADKAGNLYGTTSQGGANNAGTVFKVSPGGTETTLYTFTGGSDGGDPLASLIADKAGNHYGTTSMGGAENSGTVFEVAADGTETVLYSFTGGNDGAAPMGGLITDKAGNIYGTTSLGGANNRGTVFEIAAGGTERVLYSFTGKSDGGYPMAGVIADAAGNLYGTTETGGKGYEGTVFKLATDGTETVLHAFSRKKTDGEYPWGGLVMDKAGNLYGTTRGGGQYGSGTVFKVAADGTETISHSFAGGSDGADPAAGLIRDKAGNLYGTTQMGGTGTACENGCGTIFEIGK
ncbi:MAG TPA: choice-of-anchor tandem repeat GloVer-containing protein [Rhizomicrobium sp.]|nr:choice-of-anchor tandem repeat GloVer-containing protein [Rhizomicrobium sp.]